jgi:hypothetical protein
MLRKGERCVILPLHGVETYVEAGNLEGICEELAKGIAEGR